MERQALKEMCHIQAHKAEHDPEDTLFVSLTRRDVWHILYGIMCGSDTSPDLENLGANLLERIAEVMEVQKHGSWGTSGEETA